MERHFLLRNLTIGLCSVALSTVILSIHNNVVHANSMSNQTTTEVQKADPAVSKIDDQETSNTTPEPDANATPEKPSDKPKIKPSEKQNNSQQVDNKKATVPKFDQKPVVINMSRDVMHDAIWRITKPARTIRENHDQYVLLNNWKIDQHKASVKPVVYVKKLNINKLKLNKHQKAKVRAIEQKMRKMNIDYRLHINADGSITVRIYRGNTIIACRTFGNMNQVKQLIKAYLG